MGFKVTSIDVEHAARYEGKSTYTLAKLFRLAMDSIISQSNKPLKLSIRFGFTGTVAHFTPDYPIMKGEACNVH